MTHTQTECLAEIRNAYICMCGILRKIARKNLTDAQGLIEIGVELRRQRDSFMEMDKEGGQMNLEVLTECDDVEKWHRVLSIDFEPENGRVFVSISHGPKECGFLLDCTSSVPITSTKGFREKNG